MKVLFRKFATWLGFKDQLAQEYSQLSEEDKANYNGGGAYPGAINLIEETKELSINGKRYKFKTRDVGKINSNGYYVVDKINTGKYCWLPLTNFYQYIAAAPEQTVIKTIGTFTVDELGNIKLICGRVENVTIELCEKDHMTYVKVYTPYYIKGANNGNINGCYIMFHINSRITIGELCSFGDNDKTRIFIGNGNNDVATSFEINIPVIANNGKWIIDDNGKIILNRTLPIDEIIYDICNEPEARFSKKYRRKYHIFTKLNSNNRVSFFGKPPHEQKCHSGKKFKYKNIIIFPSIDDIERKPVGTNSFAVKRWFAQRKTNTESVVTGEPPEIKYKLTHVDYLVARIGPDSKIIYDEQTIRIRYWFKKKNNKLFSWYEIK